MELHDAIKTIIAQFGIDILSDRKFINALQDYYRFDVPAKKRIVASLVEDGQLKRLVNCDDAMLEINRIVDFEYNNNGFQTDITKQILLEFLKGIGSIIDFMQHNLNDKIQDNDVDINYQSNEDIIDKISLNEIIQSKSRVDILTGSILLKINILSSKTEGDGWFQDGETIKAFNIYKSNSNVASSLIRLALCYLYGIGTCVDYKKAEACFRKILSLINNDAYAQYGLGLLSELRNDIPPNYIESVRWYMKSSEKMFSPAITNLGICYFKGKGVTKDYKEAVKWFKKAAKQGNACAQAYLGNCFLNGLGVRKNISEAVQLFIKSADQQHLLGEYYLGYCYENGIGVMQSKAEARRLYTASAAQGNEDAKKCLTTLI